MKSLRVKAQTLVDAPPHEVECTMKDPQTIASFPGVKRAFVGHPGMRLDVEIPGVHLRDRFVLKWWKPREEVDEKIYPFGVEGGRWVTGCGEVHMAKIDAAHAQIAIQWEIELPRWAWFIPGLPTTAKVWLRSASRRWLAGIRTSMESAVRTLTDPRLTLGDIGA